MSLSTDINDPNRARYGLIETFTTAEKDTSKVLVPDGDNGVVFADSTGLSVDWSKITGDINTNPDLPFTQTPTLVMFDRDVQFPNQSVGLGGGITIGATNELVVLTNTSDGSFAYSPQVNITDKLSIEGVTYIDPFETFEKTDPEGNLQPVQDRTIDSISFVDDISGVTKYFALVTVPEAFGDVITYTWYLRSSTGFVNGYIRAYQGIKSDPNDTSYVWSTATINDIKVNTGQAPGASNPLYNKAADVVNDISLPLLNDGFFQKDLDTLTFVLICDNEFILEAGEIPDGGGGFIDYPYILVDGAKWRTTTLSSRLDQDTVIYVSKVGKDTNLGLNINDPKLTIQEAILDAILLVPLETNQIVIEVIDAGDYTDAVNLPEWVHLKAPNASLDGILDVSDNCIVEFRRCQRSTAGGSVIKKTTGTGFAKISVELLLVRDGDQNGLLANMGVIHIDAAAVVVDGLDSYGIKARDGSRVSFNISEMSLLNGAIGIGNDSSGGIDPNFLSGNILYVKDDGTGCFVKSVKDGDIVNIQGGSVLVDKLYDMGVNTTLNAFLTDASGIDSSIEDPTSTVNLTLAGGDTNTKGWGFYTDDVTSNQVVTTTDLKLLINGDGSNSNEEYLPKNNGSIWDVSTSQMTPAEVGASYDVRIQLDITSLSGNPTQMNFKLDIGGGATPTIVIMEQTVTLKNNVPQSVVISTPIFCLQTFVDNGGQMFMSSNTGTITIENRTILLVRTS
jgi:hypothetical protein